MSASRPEDEAPPETSFWELLVVRALNVPVVIAGRLLDLAVLLPRPRLLRAYFALWIARWARSPYRWNHSFDATMRLRATGQTKRELLFGEVPVFTALWLLRRHKLRRGGALLDLGAGRGRPLLAARWLGAAARGLELLPEHVELSAGPLSLVGAQLEAADALSAPLGEPTHVLLNWCAFSETTRARLANRLAALPTGTVILAVATPLDVSRFPRVATHLALFTWGVERVHVHWVPPAPGA